jgi:DNA-binding NarL/FixJ family response regulator
MPIKIGLAEDNVNLRKSIANNMSLFEEVELLFIGANGIEVLHLLEEHKPDLILMDINMPGMNGIDATRQVKEKYPDIKVMMLTVFDEDEKIFQSILAGASGYMLKDEKPAKIMEAIEECMEGGAPMSPVIASKALQLLRGKREQQNKNAEEYGLTKRELEILQKTSEGLTNNQIAEVLFISPKTVRKHIENIYQKLQVHNRVEAVNVAVRDKLISIGLPIVSALLRFVFN